MDSEQQEFVFNDTSSENSTYDNSTFNATEETTKEFVKVSIYTPIIYLTILISVFMLFSSIYRKKKLSNKINKATSLFPRNYSKEIYLQLKEQDPKPNPKVLKAALLRRASETIRKMFKLKETEAYVNTLYQNGSIGHDYFEAFQLEKKLNELEMTELAIEANQLKAGWAQQFFPVVQEITINEALRRRLTAIEARKEELAEEWGLVEGMEKKLIAAESNADDKESKDKKK